MSAIDTTSAAIRPPAQRHRIAQASTAPITQKPGRVALSPSPLTYGERAIATTATTRSATSSVGVRRAGAAYAQTAKAVHATRNAITSQPTTGWS